MKKQMNRFQRSKKQVPAFAVMLAVTAMASHALAVDKNWIGISGAFYDSSSSWSPTGAPTASDVAIFNLAGSYTVGFDNVTGNRTVSSIFVGPDSTVPTFAHIGTTGGDLTWTASGATMRGAGIATFGGTTGQTSTRALHVAIAGNMEVSGSRIVRVQGHSDLTYGTMTLGSSLGAGTFIVSTNSNVSGGSVNVGVNTGAETSLTSSFRVENGGNATVGNLIIGTSLGHGFGLNSNGTLTANAMTIGSSGQGRGLFVAEGISSVTTVNGTTTVGSGALSSATATARDGSTLNLGFLNLGISGELNVLGGNVVANTLAMRGKILVNTGTLSLQNFSAISIDGVADMTQFDFVAGTVQFRIAALTYNNTPYSVSTIAPVFGTSAHEVTTGRTLDLAGRLDVTQPLTLNGGTIRTRDLLNGQRLTFTSGTLEIDSPVMLGTTGQLRRDVDLPANARLVAINSNSIESLAGSITVIRDGAYLEGNTLTNAGELILDGINSRVVTRSTGSVPIVNTSTGRISGTGRITGSVANQGLIQLREGDALRFTNTLFNNASGRIQGRGSIDAAQLSNAGRIELSAGFTDVTAPVVNTGRIIASGGATVSFFGPVTNSAGAEIRTAAGGRTAFYSPVNGPGSFTGTGVVQFEDTYSPGSSPGLIAFGGDVELTHASLLQIELGGTTRGAQYDALDITGGVDIVGRLALSTLGGYTPAYLFAHRVIDASSRAGIFRQIDGIALSPTRYLAVTYNTLGDVMVTATIPGDANVDGAVNFDDLLALAQNYGNTQRTWSQGDFGGDGYVNFDDLLLLAQNYGVSLLNGATITDDTLAAEFAAHWALALQSVPEPTSLTVLAAGAMLVGRRRRK